MASYCFFTIKIQRHSTKLPVTRALLTFNLITKHSPLDGCKQSSMSPIVLASVSFPRWLHASLFMTWDAFSLVINMAILSHHPNPAQPYLPRVPKGSCCLSNSFLLYHHFWLLPFRASIMAWHDRLYGFLGTAHLCCWKASTPEWWYWLSHPLLDYLCTEVSSLHFTRISPADL